MKKIKIFLASSNELRADREAFEREIYRKSKTWIDKGISLHLEIWEDLSAAVSQSRSQDEYNKKIKEADIFVLLAYSKVGIYTAEEFDQAYEVFKKNKKIRIFTYFKNSGKEKEGSLEEFKKELETIEHFYASYSDFNDLWIQFNKELDRVLLKGNQEKEAKKSISQDLLFGVGLSLSILAVALAWFSPNPSGIQYIAIRILFLLGAGFLGGFIGGFLSFKYQNMIQAGGAFALAMIVYFLNPAANFNHEEQILLTGTIYLNGIPTENIKVRFQQAQKDRTSNSYGTFSIQTHNIELKDTLDFYFKNEKLGLDTVVHLANDNLDLRNLNFKLTKETEKKDKKEDDTPTTEEVESDKKEKEKQVKLIQNLHKITLKGNLNLVSKVIFDGLEYTPNKNGVLNLKNVPDGVEDEKILEIQFKDATTTPYTQRVTKNITEIPFD